MDIMQQCIPQVKQQCQRRLPWINKNIMCAIKQRDRLYHKFKISQTAFAWKKYKEMRNRLVKLIRSSKSVFFSNLSRTAADPQKFWKIVNTLKNVSGHIPTLVCDNESVSEDIEKAEVHFLL